MGPGVKPSQFSHRGVFGRKSIEKSEENLYWADSSTKAKSRSCRLARVDVDGNGVRDSVGICIANIYHELSGGTYKHIVQFDMPHTLKGHQRWRSHPLVGVSGTEIIFNPRKIKKHKRRVGHAYHESAVLITGSSPLHRALYKSMDRMEKLLKSTEPQDQKRVEKIRKLAKFNP